MTLARVFVPFAMGYFLSYLMRVVNAVIAPDLVRDLGLTAADLGLLTSANFLAFAVAQLPLGILLDRFGPRRTEAAIRGAGARVVGRQGRTVVLSVEGSGLEAQAKPNSKLTAAESGAGSPS